MGSAYLQPRLSPPALGTVDQSLCEWGYYFHCASFTDKLKTEVVADQGNIILPAGYWCVVQRRQGISLDVSNGTGGIAKAVPDVFDMLPLQLQETASDRHCRDILPADTDRFL